jgi:hypothetical protein
LGPRAEDASRVVWPCGSAFRHRHSRAGPDGGIASAAGVAGSLMRQAAHLPTTRSFRRGPEALADRARTGGSAANATPATTKASANGSPRRPEMVVGDLAVWPIRGFSPFVRSSTLTSMAHHYVYGHANDRLSPLPHLRDRPRQRRSSRIRVRRLRACPREGHRTAHGRV